jgi:hypothetical protein
MSTSSGKSKLAHKLVSALSAASLQKHVLRMPCSAAETAARDLEARNSIARRSADPSSEYCAVQPSAALRARDLIGGHADPISTRLLLLGGGTSFRGPKA